MAIYDLSGPEMDLTERVAGASRKTGNSGALAAKRAKWAEIGEALQSAFQSQLDAAASGGKVRPIDLSKLCDAFGLQQGALKNKVKGYKATVTNGIVSLSWTQSKEDSAKFIKEVNGAVFPGQLRLKGGLNLVRSFSWAGKTFVLDPKFKDETYTRGDEESPRFYFLEVGIFWHSGSPTMRSK